MAQSYLNQANLPRGLRNNNPGNLIYTSIPWEGKLSYDQNKDYEGNPSNIKRKFEQFKELRYGIRAKMRDLINDISKGKNTIEKLITEFAPAFENNTVAYIASVANSLGILPKAVITEISEDFLIGLCQAISQVENGKEFNKYISIQDYKDALAILGTTAIPVIKKKKIIR